MSKKLMKRNKSTERQCFCFGVYTYNKCIARAVEVAVWENSSEVAERTFEIEKCATSNMEMDRKSYICSKHSSVESA